jgi:hypothetical protein
MNPKTRIRISSTIDLLKITNEKKYTQDQVINMALDALYIVDKSLANEKAVRDYALLKMEAKKIRDNNISSTWGN